MERWLAEPLKLDEPYPKRLPMLTKRLAHPSLSPIFSLTLALSNQQIAEAFRGIDASLMRRPRSLTVEGDDPRKTVRLALSTELAWRGFSKAQADSLRASAL